MLRTSFFRRDVEMFWNTGEKCNLDGIIQNQILCRSFQSTLSAVFAEGQIIPAKWIRITTLNAKQRTQADGIVQIAYA